MAFRPVSDDVMKLAEQAVSASASGDYTEYDSADLVAAATALSLEKAAPRLVSDDYDTRAENYSEEFGSSANRILTIAMARFLDEDENNHSFFESRGSGVPYVAAAALQIASAAKIMDFLNDPASRTLNDEQIILADNAKIDPALMKDLSLIAEGRFENLSPEMSAALKTALEQPLEGNLGKEISTSSRAVDYIVGNDEAMLEKMRNMDLDMGEFQPVSDSSLKAVLDFHAKGESSGFRPIDDAMKLIGIQGRMKEKASSRDPIVIAQARMIEDGRWSIAASPPEIASMIVSDAEIMKEAALNRDPTREDICKASGRYDKLDESDRETVERQILFSLKTPAIERVRLHTDFAEIEESRNIERVRSIDFATFSAMNQNGNGFC